MKVTVFVPSHLVHQNDGSNDLNNEHQHEGLQDNTRDSEATAALAMLSFAQQPVGGAGGQQTQFSRTIPMQGGGGVSENWVRVGSCRDANDFELFKQCQNHFFVKGHSSTANGDMRGDGFLSRGEVVSSFLSGHTAGVYLKVRILSILN